MCPVAPALAWSFLRSRVQVPRMPPLALGLRPTLRKIRKALRRAEARSTGNPSRACARLTGGLCEVAFEQHLEVPPASA